MDPAATPSRWPMRLFAAVAVFIVVSTSAWAAWFEVSDPDAFWHAAIGRHMWLERVLPPFPDPLSSTATGPFTFGEPISDLLFYALYRLGDVRAILVAKSVVVALWALLLTLALPGSAQARAWAAALVIGTSTPQLLERPYLLSFVLFSVARLLCERDVSGWTVDSTSAPTRRPPFRLAVLLAILAVLWANVHRSSWLLGAVVLGHLAAMWRGRRLRLHIAAALCAAPLLALLANPAGSQSIATAIDNIAASSHDIEMIHEWKRLSLALVFDECPALFGLLLFALLGLLQRRRIDDTIVIGIAAVLSFRARFIPYLAIALAPLAAAGVDVVLRAAARSVRPTVAWGATCLAVGAIVVTQALWVVPLELRDARIGARVPLDAIWWLADNTPPGKLWNSFNASGPLTYYAAPLYRVSIDGRLGNTVYSRPLVDAALAGQTDADVGRALLREHGVDIVLATDDFAWIHHEPDWELVYRDDVSAIWMRASANTLAFLEAHPQLMAARDDARDGLIAGCKDSSQAIAEFDTWLREAPGAVIAWQSWRACMRARGDQDAAADASLAIEELAPGAAYPDRGSGGG